MPAHDTTQTAHDITKSYADVPSLAQYIVSVSDPESIGNVDPTKLPDNAATVDFMIADKKDQVAVVKQIVADLNVQFSIEALEWLGVWTLVLRLHGPIGVLIQAYELAMRSLRQYDDFDETVTEHEPGRYIANEIYGNWIG